MAITGTASGTLYYGPNTSTYSSDTSVSGTVTILWKEGSFYYVETATSPKRRNYIATGSVTSITGGTPSTFTHSLATRWVNSGTDTYCGPSSSYARAGSLSTGEQVSYVSPKNEGDYALVEYNVTGTTKKKRAWFAHMKLSTSQPPREVGTRPVGTSFKTNDYPNYPSGNYHGGTDIGATEGASAGNTVKAAFAGTVKAIENSNAAGQGTSYGNYVCIESTINGTVYRHYYCHLATVSVANNASVTKGQSIGTVGNTGNCIPSTYYHLHLEFRKGNFSHTSDTVDPKSFF